MLVNKAQIHTLLYILPLLFILLSGRQANAQEALQRGFQGVISAGLNASQVDGDGLSGFDMPGVMIGVGAIYRYSEKVSFGPEFFFSQKGSRSTQDDLNKFGQDIFIRHRTNYIDLPILAHYAATPRFTLSGGPSFNALISANVENARTPRVSIPTFWRPVDVGVVGGFEINVYGKLYFAARWFYSVLPAERSDLSTFTTFQIVGQGAGMRNNTISVLLRVKV